jgi:hypothetical protein
MLDFLLLMCTHVQVGNMEEPGVHDRTRLYVLRGRFTAWLRVSFALIVAHVRLNSGNAFSTDEKRRP